MDTWIRGYLEFASTPTAKSSYITPSAESCNVSCRVCLCATSCPSLPNRSRVPCRVCPDVPHATDRDTEHTEVRALSAHNAQLRD